MNTLIQKKKRKKKRKKKEMSIKSYSLLHLSYQFFPLFFFKLRGLHFKKKCQTGLFSLVYSSKHKLRQNFTFVFGSKGFDKISLTLFKREDIIYFVYLVNVTFVLKSQSDKYLNFSYVLLKYYVLHCVFMSVTIVHARTTFL